jgi:phage terminase large subunit-like protein
VIGGKAIEDPSAYVKGLSTEELRKFLAETTQEAESIQQATAFQRFQPLPYQVPFLRSEAEVRAFIAANQIGKTATGAIVTISAALGDKPVSLGGTGKGRWPRDKMRGKRFFVGGETFDSLRDNIIPKLREYVSQGSMLKGPPKRNAQGLDVTWKFVTGAEVHLMSYQQPTDAFEGAPWDGAWFDEPPPQVIFNAVRRGLMARKGWTIMTMTPLKEPWVLDELIRPSEDESHPLHGKVEVFGARMHENCSECHGGYLPHARIESFLASLPPNERKAREFGEFLDLQGLEFDYVTEETHVIPDFDSYRSWPIVEIVDPAMKRPLHVMWFAVDPDEYWYCVHAALIPNDGFRRMVMDIQKHRGFVGRQPDVAIMDQRGGQHRVDIDRQMDWFQKFHEAGLRYDKSTDGHVQSLHDWLRPQFDPVKGERMVPRLRFFKHVADMDQGPLWGFRRFVWSPTDSTKRQYEQKGKDWIDCAMYARLAGLTYRRLAARGEDAPESRPSLASSYTTRTDPRPHPRREKRPSLSNSYGAWTKMIQRGYS